MSRRSQLRILRAAIALTVIAAIASGVGRGVVRVRSSANGMRDT